MPSWHPAATTHWAVDASILSLMDEEHLAAERRKNPSFIDDPTGHLALVPCAEGGAVSGTALRIKINEPAVRSPPQMEMVAVLCAHALTRAVAPSPPTVYTDLTTCGPGIKKLPLRINRRTGSKKPWMPELRHIFDLLGPAEFQLVQAAWIPRKSTPAMALADALSKMHRRQSASEVPVPDGCWIDLPFNTVVEQMKRINPSAVESGPLAGGDTPAANRILD